MREICAKLPKTKSGQPAFEIGETVVRLPYYKPLLFMRDQFVGRAMVGNVECETAPQSVTSISDESNDGPDSMMVASESTLERSWEGSTPAAEADANPVTRKNTPRRKRQTLDEEFLAIEKEKMINFKKAIETQEMKDEWDLFSSSMCCDLRKLKDPLIIMRVKANINKCVNDAVLDQLSLDARNSSFSVEHQTRGGTSYFTENQSSGSYQGSSTNRSTPSQISDDADFYHYQTQYHQI